MVQALQGMVVLVLWTLLLWEQDLVQAQELVQEQVQDPGPQGPAQAWVRAHQVQDLALVHQVQDLDPVHLALVRQVQVAIHQVQVAVHPVQEQVHQVQVQVHRVLVQAPTGLSELLKDKER